jgi:hypothetical protein
MGDEINPSARVFRRKRRFQGATWTPNTISAAVEDGAWCAKCRMRHGYKGSGLKMGYEKTNKGTWRLLWTCKKTGNVIEVMDLKKVYTQETETLGGKDV